MKKNILLFLLILFLFSFCKSRPQILPEISDYLKLDDLTQIDFNHKVKKSFVKENEVLFLTEDNKVFILDLNKKKIEDLNINKSNILIKKILFFNKRIVVFSDKKRGFLFIRKNKRILNFVYKKRIRIYFDLNGILLYSLNKNLMFFDYNKNKVIKSLKFKSKVVFVQKLDKGFIAFEKNSAVFFENMRITKEINIPYELKSEVLVDKDFFFFGDVNKFLVKFDFKKKKTVWRLKLPAVLTKKPVKLYKYVVVFPNDNNIYFVNKRGSVKWWYKFLWEELFDSLILNENIGYFLYNGKFIFINPKKKNAVLFDSEIDLKNLLNLFVYNNDVYVLLNEDEKIIIKRVFNEIGVVISIDSEDLLLPRRSIVFLLKPVNVFKPRVEVRLIEKKSQKTIFQKEIEFNDYLMRFSYFFEKPGEFEIEVKSVENGKQHVNTLDFNLFDLEEKLNNIYYKLILNDSKK